jgi:hypothetical protein
VAESLGIAGLAIWRSGGADHYRADRRAGFNMHWQSVGALICSCWTSRRQPWTRCRATRSGKPCGKLPRMARACS